MHEHPITPPRIYFLVFLALLVLLAVTVGIAFLDLGIFNPVAALLIALVKALLVVLFFMQVRFSSKLTRLFVAAGLIWFMIMILPIIGDYISRGIFKF